MDLNKKACTCANVTYAQIIRAAEQGAASFEDLKRMTNCGQGCGKCRDFIEHYLRQLSAER